MVLLSTDCASENGFSEVREAGLPTEVITMILTCAVDDMRSRQHGRAVSKLLHTSRWLRHRAITAFAPLTLYETVLNNADGTDGFAVCRHLSTFVWDVLYTHFVVDISLYHHEDRNYTTLSQCFDAVTTSAEALIDSICCHVKVMKSEAGQATTEQELYSDVWNLPSGQQTATDQDACSVVS